MKRSEYTPIFQIPGKHWSVLLSKKLEWGMEQHDRFLVFDNENYTTCMALLPLLECSYHEVMTWVTEGLTTHRLSEELRFSFPFEGIVKRAFDWSTSYWPRLATDWIEHGFPLNAQIISLMKPIPQNKRYTQNLRHRVFRIIARYERNHQKNEPASSPSTNA